MTLAKIILGLIVICLVLIYLALRSILKILKQLDHRLTATEVVLLKPKGRR